MRPPLQQATILLTGASAGIGWAMAHELATTARCLILVARRQERLEALKAELLKRNATLQVIVAPCDLTDTDAIDDLLTQLKAQAPQIDILINNAGFGDIGAFEFGDWDKLQRMIALNITGLTYLTHRLIKPMRERRSGGILNVSSGFGLSFMPGFAVYVGTKHYVTGFTECLRCEVAGFGVTVSQVCPGPVPTEFEAIAENPLEHSVPSFLEISAEHCARESLRGFAKGKALIVPGWRAKFLLWFSRLSPRPLTRFVLSLGSKTLYKPNLSDSSD